MLDAIRPTPNKIISPNTKKNALEPTGPFQEKRFSKWFSNHKELTLWVGILLVVGLVLGIWISQIRHSPLPIIPPSEVLGSSDLSTVQSSLNTLFQDITRQWEQLQNTATARPEPPLSQEELEALAQKLTSLTSLPTSTPSTTLPSSQ